MRGQQLQVAITLETENIKYLFISSKLRVKKTEDESIANFQIACCLKQNVILNDKLSSCIENEKKMKRKKQVNISLIDVLQLTNHFESERISKNLQQDSHRL